MAVPAQATAPVLVDDYLEGEKTALFRNEYYRGEVFAMSGGFPEHALLAANFVRELGNVLGKRGRVFGSDLKVHVAAHDLFTYPDVSVVWGALEVAGNGYAIPNPTILVEVLSPSTASYDRGTKCRFYRSLASLREYVLVAQDYRGVEVFRRDADGHWVLHEPAGGIVELASVDAALRLDDLYASVDVPDVPPLREDRPE